MARSLDNYEMNTVHQGSMHTRKIIQDLNDEFGEHGLNVTTEKFSSLIDKINGLLSEFALECGWPEEIEGGQGYEECELYEAVLAAVVEELS